MSSTIIIGFLDRTHVCIQTDFTPPLADDEHRELLVHAAMLTGRAFASLSPERQRTFAGILREWVAARFETCPLQIQDGDPMACPHRFASAFLAPVREYALATIGCNREAGGVEYFLPMAAAAYLRHVTVTDHDPEELLKPALALCAAVAIHPVTPANHFQMAAASLPKIAPVVDRTEPADPVADDPPAAEEPAGGEAAGGESRRHLHETRRSLIVSACLAALLIVLGVQYLSTREPKAGGEAAVAQRPTPPPAPPKPVAPPPAPAPAALPSHPSLAVNSLPKGNGAVKPPSPQARAYLRKVRDLAENSLAQVEVMLAAADRKEMVGDELVETMDHGTRQLQTWRRQFAALAPPAALTGQHRAVGRIMTELGRIAQGIQPQPPTPDAGAIRDRLSLVHEELVQVLNEAEAF